MSGEFEQEPISEREDFLSSDVYEQLREASRLMWSTTINGVFSPALLSKQDHDTVIVYGLLNVAILEAQRRVVPDDYNGMQYICRGHGEEESSAASPSASACHKDDPCRQFDSLDDPATRGHVEHASPSLWRKCYPRIYSDPKCGPYYSPKFCAWMMAKIALIAKQVPVDIDNPYDFFAVSHLARFGVPMFWLSDSIAQAIRKTVPPGAIDWATLRMPFDAGVFMLPKGSLTHPESEADVRFVVYVRLQVGEEFVSPLDPELTYGFRKRDGMVFMAAVGPELEPCHWVVPLDEVSVMSIMDLDDMFLTESSTSRGRHISDATKHLGTGVAHYVLGTILLMNARPELVTRGARLKCVMKKGDTLTEFWTPNVIGEHYKVRRESVDDGGTHNSPRFHWVRGFYRQQAYGAGCELRREQWVEPYMRGIDPAIGPEPSPSSALHLTSSK